MIEIKVGLKNIDIVSKQLTSIVNKKDMIVLLRGDLASGKTTLVKNYVKILGIEEEVTSPTFLIQTNYGKKIFHYDLYNTTLSQFISLGLLEEFEKTGIHFVEWGEDDLRELLTSYGFEVMVIDIVKIQDKRQYKIYE